MLKSIARKLIKSLLWVLDKDHRSTNEIGMDDMKKFTHVIDTKFQSDFGTASKVFRTVPYETWKLETETKTLIGADRHRVILQDGSCAWLEDLVEGDIISTDNGFEKVISCKKLDFKMHMYCLQIDTAEHQFYTNGILSHNTTCAAGFLLWKAMFTPDQTILVVANKYSQALEIMERIRYTYENIPNHIRAGVTDYNKGNITFDNGSRIISRATATDAGRGLAISLLYCLDGDTTVTLRDKLTGEIKDISLSELYNELDQ
jgi:hypothetical protein